MEQLCLKILSGQFKYGKAEFWGHGWGGASLKVMHYKERKYNILTNKKERNTPNIMSSQACCVGVASNSRP